MRVTLCVFATAVCGLLAQVTNADTVIITRRNLGDEQKAYGATLAQANNGVDPTVTELPDPEDNGDDGTVTAYSEASAFAGSSYGHTTSFTTSFCDIPPLDVALAGNLGVDMSCTMIGFAATGWSSIISNAKGESKATFDVAESGTLYGSMTTSMIEKMSERDPTVAPVIRVQVGDSWIETQYGGTYGYLASATGPGTTFYSPEASGGGTFYFSQSVSSSFSVSIGGFLDLLYYSTEIYNESSEVSGHAHFYVEN